ncbi:MAG: 1,4-alpha-glucan branching enzyme, partial [Proteobacteria bacterium]|nr:1,4-alpha-glucan branching enzyme [Pseudomonadota bacterium]
MSSKNTTSPLHIEPYDLHLFGQGGHWDLYRILGAHPHAEKKRKGYRFAVWAPNAQAVCVAGGFNDWAWDTHPLFPVGSSGIWAGFIPGITRDISYRYAVTDGNGQTRLKTDPMAFASEMRPGTAGVTAELDSYRWNDTDWMAGRRATGLPLDKPLSFYEVHAGSWRRDGAGFLSYGEMADRLIPYVKDLGFTHIEFMPMAEHPLDESWGYQPSHYFAPTSRFGSPDELRQLIDRCHQEGIGVVFDWVPGHFPKDDWSLGRFDGTALYEHEDPRLGEHPDWGTYIFNFGRHEVKNFLLSNALYWLKEFHIDGLR